MSSRESKSRNKSRREETSRLGGSLDNLSLNPTYLYGVRIRTYASSIDLGREWGSRSIQSQSSKAGPGGCHSGIVEV